MKLDQHTIRVLTNFSNINNSIVVKAGNELRTCPESKTILAEAVVSDSFPVDFAIYNLRKFLGCFSVYNDPDVEFNDDYVVISSGSNSIRVYYCNPDLITFPAKRLNLPSEDVSFELTEENLNHLQKTANILSCDNILITPGKDNTVFVTATDIANPTSDSSTMQLPAKYTLPKFKVNLKMSNLKLISGTYQVYISTKMSLFRNTAKNLQYFVAIEAGSTFE